MKQGCWAKMAMGAACLALAACSGQTSNPSAEAEDDGGEGGREGKEDGDDPQDGQAAAAVAQGPRLRRLTVKQYTNAVRDLLGEAIKLPDNLSPDTRYGGFASIAASQVALSASEVEWFEAAAVSVAEQVMAPAARGTLISCTPSSGDDTCVRSFIEALGLRAWRRPLEDTEVERYLRMAKAVTIASQDAWQGPHSVLVALLQSPNFLYRAELGRPTGGQSEARSYDGYELAARLAFTLTDSPPGPQLLDAAKNGEFSGTAVAKNLALHAQRLLDSPRAEAAIMDMFGELFLLDDAAKVQKDKAIYPATSATLGPAMREESLRFAKRHALGDKSSLRRLFDARTTFVNAELAALYGLPRPAGDAFEDRTFPETSLRAGILTHGSVLSLQAHDGSTNPSRRGKFVREMILCEAVPAPPPNIPELPDPMAGNTPRTMRERLTTHRENPVCASCHAFIDPIGLAFENFDGIGAERTTEVGKRIDASGDLDGKAFAGPRELAQLLAEKEEVMECMARHWFRFAQGYVESDAEEPTLDDLVSRFRAANFNFPQLILAFVKHPSFQAAGPLR